MLRKFFLAIVFFLGFASPAFASGSYCASGSGTSAYNGTYTSIGSGHNGYSDEWTNGSTFIDVVTFTGVYYYSMNLSGLLNEGSSGYYWVIGSSPTFSELPTDSSWLSSAASLPVPTLVSGACAGGGGGGATTTPVFFVPVDLFFSTASSTCTPNGSTPPEYSCVSSSTIQQLNKFSVDYTQLVILAGYAFALASMVFVVWLFKKRI